ncbi:MAG TPA: hypothetical protein VF070_22800 [Streptosporangiaceae bacterium]
MLAQGAPPWLASIQAELYEAVHEGRAAHTAVVTPTVETLTGRPPRTIQQFAADNFGSSRRTGPAG